MEAKPPRRTRERILEVSLRLFNEIGEPNVTTTTIAEEMKISPGNLYYHFRNKDDIINSIFVQFEEEIERRLRLPDDHKPTLEDVGTYLEYMSEFLWRFRFLYRDLNDLLARNRLLEKHFKEIVGHKKRFAREMCELLVADGEMEITPEQIDVVTTNMVVLSTYWLSYQFVMNPRNYNNPAEISAGLHQASYHIVSQMAPFLKGKTLSMYNEMARKATLPKGAQ